MFQKQLCMKEMRSLPVTVCKEWPLGVMCCLAKAQMRQKCSSLRNMRQMTCKYLSYFLLAIFTLYSSLSFRKYVQLSCLLTLKCYTLKSPSIIFFRLS